MVSLEKQRQLYYNKLNNSIKEITDPIKKERELIYNDLRKRMIELGWING